jgi:CRISPR-associated protein Cas2
MPDYVICYDVNTETKEGRRRLRKVAQACLDHGQRVQYSVFECSLEALAFARLLARCQRILDPTTDSLRVYRLAGGRDGAAVVLGQDRYVDLKGPLLI